MTRLPAILNASEEDIQLLLSAQAHIGTKNADINMLPYVFKRRPDGECRIRLSRVAWGEETTG
ncbi:hypothetical protein BC936DRAFT_140399 [Jimgerdemannia flammicorona]|uniref:Uncharacterized protein n=1 Tax=Jimgerdemannia flammicorona TaxID=994334 RepID=A0A433AUD5_9FUNG|nr:hypothetical protein BC936DRAFT_140399 [Jimgerdemannia flammicorona]